VLPNGASLVAKYDIRYQSEYDIEWKDSTSMGPTTIYYTGYKTQEAHHIDNIGLIYTSPDQKWTASAYCKNIWDYAEKRFMNFPFTMNIAPPRTYGFTLSVRF
jgi:hypothetical protein